MVDQQLKRGGADVFASSTVFLFPALALTTGFGMALIQLVILLAVIWFANKGLCRHFAENFASIRWLVVGFAGYFIVVALRMHFSSSGISSLDGPVRFLLALSCIGFVGWFRPKARWLWIGLCIGALGAAVVAVVERAAYGIDHRAMGFTHHPITFGNLSLALGLMSVCAWSEFRNTKLAFLPIVSLFGGLTASILSGSRGGWLALLLCVLVLLHYGRKVYGKAVGYLVLLMSAIFTVAYFISGTNVQVRIAKAISDVELYFSQGDASTPLGIRFELWKGSLLMFADNPLLGVGRNHFQSTMVELIQQGRLQQSAAITYGHSHNDLLYFLASGGLLDFAFLLLFYLAPLYIFASVLAGTRGGNRPAAMAGLLLVVSFIGFGLTEAMFWLMAPKEFYATLICLFVGFCLIADERRAEPRVPNELAKSRLHFMRRIVD